MLSKLSSAVRAVTFSRENQTLRLILVSIKTRQPKLACQILSLAAASSPQKFEALALSKMPVQLLLSFRAGKLSRENETSNNVVADTRKGLIQLLNEDDLLHFQWKERNANEAEDDLIIFPDDAKFVPVAEAVDGRVYMLRFESSKAKHFFWMQVPLLRFGNLFVG